MELTMDLLPPFAPAVATLLLSILRLDPFNSRSWSKPAQAFYHVSQFAYWFCVYLATSVAAEWCAKWPLVPLLPFAVGLIVGLVGAAMASKLHKSHSSLLRIGCGIGLYVAMTSCAVGHSMYSFGRQYVVFDIAPPPYELQLHDTRDEPLTPMMENPAHLVLPRKLWDETDFNLSYKKTPLTERVTVGKHTLEQFVLSGNWVPHASIPLAKLPD